MLKVDLIHAAGCWQCESSSAALRTIAEDLAGERLEWREINVLEELDYAVSLGVLTLPAVAINGRLEFSSLPSADELRVALQRHMTSA